MIIGNNNGNNFGNNFSNNFNNKQTQENTNFNRKMNQIKNNGENTFHSNPFVEDIHSMQHSDPTSRENMRDKSLAMLQERLESGTISLDEFNKKVSQINKQK